MPDLSDCFRGAIVGTAVGDAIGLPREGLSRRRAARLFGGPPLGHQLFLGRGMTSDDTEHTCMAAQALLASAGEPRRFARSFAWRLRWWFLALPAGVGMATAKACLKLWIGFPPGRSGVWSAGNGPAMRAAVLGVYAWDDLPLLRELVAASSRITHTDPAAEHGALAIALAAAFAAGRNGPSGGVAAPLTAAVDVAVRAEAYLRFVTPPLAGTGHAPVSSYRKFCERRPMTTADDAGKACRLCRVGRCRGSGGNETERVKSRVRVTRGFTRSVFCAIR